MTSKLPTPHSQTSKQASKLKHVNACLLKDSQYQKSAGFDEIEVINQSAASLSLRDISLTTTFLNHDLKAPLMIAPMTGGMELGKTLNERWGKAAEHFGLAFGVGSQRLALNDPSVKESFMVRKFAPNALIFANLGAAQILELGEKKALDVVKMIEADALFIHLNPLQEAVQENGDTNFCGFLNALSQIVSALSKESIPVLAREVGFGFSEKTARLLIDTGIAGLDCSGAGGTSWAKVEALCSSNEGYQKLAWTFGEWGIPTVQSIQNVRRVDKNIPLIASGGIRSGVDVLKTLALGANLAAMAQPMLVAAIQSEDALFGFIEQTLQELRVAMFGAGVERISDVTTKIIEKSLRPALCHPAT